MSEIHYPEEPPDVPCSNGCGRMVPSYGEYTNCNVCIAQEQDKWKKECPNYCKVCWGWGGRVARNYPHAPDDFDACEAIEDYTVCHRCGKNGMTEDFEGPCKYCNWDCDDGVPYV